MLASAAMDRRGAWTGTPVGPDVDELCAAVGEHDGPLVLVSPEVGLTVVSATPAGDNEKVYFPDWAGNLYAVDKSTGGVVWQKKISDYTGIPGDKARATPAFTDSTLVIGNLGSGIGSPVTFWGAQWAQSNSLSGGGAPSSFKGFARNPTTPACLTPCRPGRAMMPVRNLPDSARVARTNRAEGICRAAGASRAVPIRATASITRTRRRKRFATIARCRSARAVW